MSGATGPRGSRGMARACTHPRPPLRRASRQQPKHGADAAPPTFMKVVTRGRRAHPRGAAPRADPEGGELLPQGTRRRVRARARDRERGGRTGRATSSSRSRTAAASLVARRRRAAARSSSRAPGPPRSRARGGTASSTPTAWRFSRRPRSRLRRLRRRHARAGRRGREGRAQAHGRRRARDLRPARRRAVPGAGCSRRRTAASSSSASTAAARGGLKRGEKR